MSRERVTNNARIVLLVLIVRYYTSLSHFMSMFLLDDMPILFTLLVISFVLKPPGSASAYQ